MHKCKNFYLRTARWRNKGTKSGRSLAEGCGARGPWTPPTTTYSFPVSGKCQETGTASRDVCQRRWV